MSTLKADTIQSTSGGAVTLTKQQAAKVWSNLNGTGTIAERDNFNISGYTDNGGNGDYTHSYTNSLGNTNYCYLLTADFQSGTARNANMGIDTSAQATGSMRIHTYGLSTGNADDFEVINMAIFGDLA
mgnify:CR=1 FL=1|tara:strand:+ start:272 stop:655 length:384 start_codon:yes stop_codon:yes gene_type:complete